MQNVETKNFYLRLKVIYEKLDELMQTVDNKRLYGSEKLHAQTMLRELKSSLDAEKRRYNGVRKKARMTTIEKGFYYPAVSEASSRINVKWNSIPNHQWFSELYEAKTDIEYYMDQLRMNTNY